jgi:hypothetical protein
MTRDRLILTSLVLAAMPYVRRGEQRVGETARHRLLRETLREAIVSLGGRLNDPLQAHDAVPPAPQLGRMLVHAALEAADVLGVDRVDVAVIFNAYGRWRPAPYRPEGTQ